MVSYKIWMYRVDELLIRNIGLDSDSMEDWLWRDAYNQGQLPAEAVLEFLDEHGLLEAAGPSCPSKGNGPEGDDIHDTLEAI